MNNSETLIGNKPELKNKIDPEMIKAAFDFWFNSNNHVRSPFPDYIREKLEEESIEKFLSWNSQISDKARKDINDEILAEKFEEIIFELALSMVITEDEKLTIRYPFMLRIGDIVKNKVNSEDTIDNTVIGRSYTKRGDTAFLKVQLQSASTGEKWETEFELPE